MSEDNNQRESSDTKTGDRAVLVGLVALVAIIAAIGGPSFVKARDTSQQNACVGNLRIIDSGKEQCRMAYRLTEGDTVSSASVNEYIKGDTTPVCPGGGTYTYNKIGQRPTCSITTPTSHELP